VIRSEFKIDLRPADALRRSGLRKATRIGLSRALRPVKGAVVSHAEQVRETGALAKSIRIKLKGYPSDRWVAVIGPSTAYKRSKRGKITRGPNKGGKRVVVPARYAALLERGTSRSRPRPWLRPAYDASVHRFLADAGREVGREIALELARN
jgi:hypothetical protein